jgi:hypothetical protein
MKVRVEIQAGSNGYGMVDTYEAQSVLFTRTQEKFFKNALSADGIKLIDPQLCEVPALIVLLDSGEYKVQPLVIDDGTVKVFHVEQPQKEFSEIHPKHTLVAAVIGIMFGIALAVLF